MLREYGSIPALWSMVENVFFLESTISHTKQNGHVTNRTDLLPRAGQGLEHRAELELELEPVERTEVVLEPHTLVVDLPCAEPVVDLRYIEPVADLRYIEPVADHQCTVPVVDLQCTVPVADHQCTVPVVDLQCTEPVADLAAGRIRPAVRFLLKYKILKNI